MAKQLIAQDKLEIRNIVNSVSERFEEIAMTHDAVKFQQECFFAMQAVQENSYLGTIALKNPDSLRAAVLNVAAIGLSLNPALKYAHIVPRNGKACLDIPYGGLIKLATDTGSIEWVQAEVIKEHDDFTYRGIGTKPDFKCDYFSERGKTIGTYCVAKLHSGDYLVTVMSVDECFVIRDRTAAWQSFKNNQIKSCPWSTDEGEMLKKTVIKRSSKLWPKTERLQKAVATQNEHEGIDFATEQAPVEQIESPVINGASLEKTQKVELLKIMINEKLENMTLQEKGLFLKDKLKVSTPNDLRKKSMDELVEIEKLLV